jgi:hypothetical protein
MKKKDRIGYEGFSQARPPEFPKKPPRKSIEKVVDTGPWGDPRLSPAGRPSKVAELRKKNAGPTKTRIRNA